MCCCGTDSQLCYPPLWPHVNILHPYVKKATLTLLTSIYLLGILENPNLYINACVFSFTYSTNIYEVLIRWTWLESRKNALWILWFFTLLWDCGEKIYHTSFLKLFLKMEWTADKWTEIFTHYGYHIHMWMSKNNCSLCFPNLWKRIESEGKVGAKQLGFQWRKWSPGSPWKIKLCNHSIPYYCHPKSTNPDC